jgi:hypothetical protein
LECAAAAQIVDMVNARGDDPRDIAEISGTLAIDAKISKAGDCARRERRAWR